MILTYFVIATLQTQLNLVGSTAILYGSGEITQDLVRSKSYKTYDSIVIEEDVTGISYGAFLECISTKTIKIPKSVVSIDFGSGNTFRYVRSLVEFIVDINNPNFCNDSQGAIYDKGQTILYRVPPTRTAFIIPNTVTNIYSQCFQCCILLTGITFPKSVSDIGFGIFFDTGANLQRVEFQKPAKVTSFSTQSFAYCSFPSIEIPNSVETIGKECFLKNYASTITFESGSKLTKIIAPCFSSSSVAALSLPEGLLALDAGTFSSCDALTFVLVPRSCASISESAFTGCPKLATISVAAGNHNYATVGGILFSSDNRTMVVAPATVGEVFIPAETEEIGPTAIQGCADARTIRIDGNPYFETENGILYRAGMEECIAVVGGVDSVEFNTNLKIIKEYAMYGCTKLTTVVFKGDQLEKVEKYAFAGSGIINLDLKNCVELGDYALANTKSLMELRFSGDKLKTLGTYIIEYSNVRNVYLTSKLEKISADTFRRGQSIENIYLQVNCPLVEINSGSFELNQNLKGITIPQNVETIQKNAFQSDTGLNYVNMTFCLKLKSIQDDAFSGCKSLKELYFPPSLQSLGNFAFKECQSLTMVNFSEDSNLTMISAGCFSGCSGITSISLPPNIENVDASAFEGCIRLASIGLLATSENYISSNDLLYTKDWSLIICPPGIKDVSINANVTQIVQNAFYKAMYLSKIDLSLCQKLQTIGKNTFIECGVLETVIFPPSVISIEIGLFVSCNNISELIFPLFSKLAEIPARIFAGLEELVIIEFGKAGNLSKINEGSFENCKKLTSVNVPSTIKSIDQNAFKGCINLETISYSDCDGFEMLTVSDSAFVDCVSLSKFPFEFVIEIGSNAFKNCKISKVNFSVNVNSLGDNAFLGCGLLKEVYYCGRKEVVGSSFEPGVTAYVYAAFKGMFSNCDLIRRIGNHCEILPSETFKPNLMTDCISMVGEAAILVDYQNDSDGFEGGK